MTLTTATSDWVSTNKLLMDVCDFNKDLFDTSTLSSDEIRYFNSITRGFDKQIQFFIDWLDSDEARRIFYENEQYNESTFTKIEEEIKNIVGDTSLTADEIISRIYDSGLQAGADEIRRTKYYNDATKYGLEFLQDYNHLLIDSVNTDLKKHIQAEIFTGIVAGEGMPEVANRILDATNHSLTGKTLSARQRAMMIARTETARAMTQGRLQSYANYGVHEVKILTAGDERVCAICREAAGKIFRIEKAGDLVPFHPLCRCSVMAYIRHGILQGSPDDDASIVDLTLNSYSVENGSDLEFNYISATDEYKKLSLDKNIKCSQNKELKLFKKGLPEKEIFYKYEFSDGLVIYKSKELFGVPVKKIHEIYNSIEYDKIRKSCNEIVLSNYYFKRNDGYIGGYVHRPKSNRMYILNQETGLSVDDARSTLYHEIGHCFDGEYLQYSMSKQFRGGYLFDYKKLSDSNLHFTEQQKYISEYSYDKVVEYQKGECVYDEVFAEDFAECIKFLLLKKSRLNVFGHKSEFINSII